MNFDNFTQLLQKGVRVTIGATASLIEVLQDPQNQDERFSTLMTEVGKLTDEWAEKGEKTEQEARNFVDTMLSQANLKKENGSSTPASDSTITTTAVPVAKAEVQSDLQELTEQISAMREELERLKDEDSES
ncbi:MAG: hypothetical protein F6K19_31325 [Cyanothece sp. SIO1E1]|nr:hypothetical protein [Cyanothece sp. SIO1E1]